MSVSMRWMSIQRVENSETSKIWSMAPELLELCSIFTSPSCSCCSFFCSSKDSHCFTSHVYIALSAKGKTYSYSPNKTLYAPHRQQEGRRHMTVLFFLESFELLQLSLWHFFLFCTSLWVLQANALTSGHVTHIFPIWSVSFSASLLILLGKQPQLSAVVVHLWLKGTQHVTSLHGLSKPQTSPPPACPAGINSPRLIECFDHDFLAFCSRCGWRQDPVDSNDEAQSKESRWNLLRSGWSIRGICSWVLWLRQT